MNLSKVGKNVSIYSMDSHIVGNKNRTRITNVINEPRKDALFFWKGICEDESVFYCSIFGKNGEFQFCDCDNEAYNDLLNKVSPHDAQTFEGFSYLQKGEDQPLQKWFSNAVLQEGFVDFYELQAEKNRFKSLTELAGSGQMMRFVGRLPQLDDLGLNLSDLSDPVDWDILLELDEGPSLILLDIIHKWERMQYKIIVEENILC